MIIASIVRGDRSRSIALLRHSGPNIRLGSSLKFRGRGGACRRGRLGYPSIWYGGLLSSSLENSFRIGRCDHLTVVPL